MLRVCQVAIASIVYVERNLRTFSSDLPLRTIKFCSFLFGVFTDVCIGLCRITTGVHRECYTLMLGRPSTVDRTSFNSHRLIACSELGSLHDVEVYMVPNGSVTSSQILADNCDLCLLNLHSTPPLGRVSSEHAMPFGTEEKLE